MYRVPTAAVALFGWYLMAPPLLPAPGHSDRFLIITDAPLGKWDIISSHDTAKECEERKVGISVPMMNTDAMRKVARGDAKPPFTGGEAAAIREGGSLVCISSDDPRLKDNTKH